MGFCDNCVARHTCTRPCEALEQELDAPSHGRVPTVSPNDRRMAEFIVDVATKLSPRDQAVAYLYYRSGLSQARIAEAFDLHKSTVSRILKDLRHLVLRATHTPAYKGDVS